MFADIEQKIIERLRERMGAAVHVEPLREIERVPQLRQRAPAAWVIYDGFSLAESIDSVPSIQKVRLEWFVVVAAKSSRGGGDVQDARDEADALATRAIEALLGFHLGGGRYLRLGEAPGPEYDGGYCHLPLAFTCSATFKGQQP